jgi:hypothetical protein
VDCRVRKKSGMKERQGTDHCSVPRKRREVIDTTILGAGERQRLDDGFSGHPSTVQVSFRPISRSLQNGEGMKLAGNPLA